MGVLSHRVYIEWIKRGFKKWKVSNKGNYRRKENNQKPHWCLDAEAGIWDSSATPPCYTWAVALATPFSLGLWELLLACSWALTIGTHTLLLCESVTSWRILTGLSPSQREWQALMKGNELWFEVHLNWGQIKAFLAYNY